MFFNWLKILRKGVTKLVSNKDDFGFDPRVVDAAKKVTAHRAKVVIDHILKYGKITTEELKEKYGYNHPPRAAGDVRDNGIPLKTIKVVDKTGRSIGAYVFGSYDEVQGNKLGGRKTFSKKFKEAMIQKYGSRCAITGDKYDQAYLSIDHRIPYAVSGDNPAEAHKVEDFMLLTNSGQRQKSWACENCENGKNTKDINVCRECYWASPESYSHLATKAEKRVEIIFQGDETAVYDILEKHAKVLGKSVPEFVKKTLSELNSK